MERRVLYFATFCVGFWLTWEMTFFLISASQSLWSILIWYFVVPSLGTFGFLALAELAWKRWEMVADDYVEPIAWLAPVGLGLLAFALHIAVFGSERN